MFISFNIRLRRITATMLSGIMAKFFLISNSQGEVGTYWKAVCNSNLHANTDCDGKQHTETNSFSFHFMKDECFFCKDNQRVANSLRKLSVNHAQKSKSVTMIKRRKEALQIELSTAKIKPKDSHTTDFRYHLPCWAKNKTCIVGQKRNT